MGAVSFEQKRVLSKICFEFADRNPWEKGRQSGIIRLITKLVTIDHTITTASVYVQ